MEACCSRFTAWEGGARLATAASAANTMVADHTSFIAMRLLHEHAYKIRGPLSKGTQRSVYVTRPSRVRCVAYDLNILTDLRVTSTVTYSDLDWSTVLDEKEVLVCTSAVLKQILEEKVLMMSTINVLIIDSCHLICKDDHLKCIMSHYKETEDGNRPRILALTYPLFNSNKNQNTVEDKLEFDNSESDNKFDDKSSNNDKDSIKNDENSETKLQSTEISTEMDENTEAENENENEKSNENDNDNFDKMGVYENLDDFKMYEKLEWKIDTLEEELCCQADLAEDIDGVKRFSATITKPKEFIIEYSSQSDTTALPETYFELDKYMRDTVQDALDFLNEHRYDPTEIYGEDMYEELKGIPDPSLEPKQIFTQFLYVLDQLGPYGADKAALSLLTKLEKLKIKVPYERHFLLLCICTSVFIKIRCYADFIFSQCENDWEKIKRFCTPKLLRLAEVLEKFKPNTENTSENSNADTNATNKTENKLENRNENDSSDTNATKKNENSGTNEASSNENQLEIDNETIKETVTNTDKLLKALEQCDFISLSNKIEDTVNILEMNLKDIDLSDSNTKDSKNEDHAENENDKIANANENDKKANVNDEAVNPNDKAKGFESKPNFLHKGLFGFPRRTGNRARGRGRVPRTNINRAQQMLQNPDALCGIVFIKDALMAKILFMLIADLSRSHPKLNFLCTQYSAIERPADPVKEPRDFEQQRKKQEEVLKKFRMHECNLLLATSAVEEGIDLPRCNLVLRWDVPPSYRSYGLCRGRARAPRSACVLLSHAVHDNTDKLIHNLATYKELDQIISRKCGCGIQDEPPQSEEDHADTFTNIIQPYTPSNSNTTSKTSKSKHLNKNEKVTNPNDIDQKSSNENDKSNSDNSKIDLVSNENSRCNKCSDKVVNADAVCSCVIEKSVTDVKVNEKKSDNLKETESDTIASVDLSTAIALINRYCGKLPSDTFTRLAPQWWMEEVELPVKAGSGQMRTAYICTLRLPLNCPVKYNIVGHPMPTRVLARRMVALQACRILHKSGELDNQLMPIGKDNFKAAELEIANGTYNAGGINPTDHGTDANDMARPGTTKRRQYYYKRTARVFTDCQPIIDTSDSEIDRPIPEARTEQKAEANPATDSPNSATPGVKRNMLYAIVCSLWCALPERYNTRGRRLHAPQTARQALGILCARVAPAHLQIPAFPVYTRSGEVRVSVEHVPEADVRMSPRRGRLVRRFMRFVFAEVLRVRRRGMKLQSEGSTHNNYYIVPTIKTTKEDGTTKIDIDWSFLELIYQHTEEKKHSELEKPILWHQDEEEAEDMINRTKNENDSITNEKAKETKSEIVSSKNGNEDNRENENDDTCIEFAKEEIINPKNDHDINSKIESDIHSKNDSDIFQNDKIGSKNENDNTPIEIDTTNTNSSTEHSSDKIPNGQESNDNDKSDASTPTENNYSNSANWKRVTKNDKNRNDKKKILKKLSNPLLKPGETFTFDAEKYREAVVTPWYRNQDQPQFFLVAEICWNLTPDSAFPSATHTTFRHYYNSKYNVDLTQSSQPLLDVDHTSARLNLLTPRYVNRKGVALPVSSERTRRAKRDRLDQKQILVPELCRVHPFAAPLWFATVALPCVLYRINALLIADEIRAAVAIDVGLGVPKITDDTCPGFQWPPLDFGWSLAEVLSADSDKEKKIEEGDTPINEQESGTKEEDEGIQAEVEDSEKDSTEDGSKEKTINDILQEKEDAENCFEIGTWSNEMASSIPQRAAHCDDYMEPLPSNLTFCTSASGGTNWCDPVQKSQSKFNPSRAFSVADSDCSYMSSDFDTDDSDLNSECSDEETDTSGFCSSRNSNAAMGVRIEYKTAHEAEAVDLERMKRATLAPPLDERDEAIDRSEMEIYMKSGDAPEQYKRKFHDSVSQHKRDITEKGLLILKDQAIAEILPETTKSAVAELKVAKTDEEIAKTTTAEQNVSKSNRDIAKTATMEQKVEKPDEEIDKTTITEQKVAKSDREIAETTATEQKVGKTEEKIAKTTITEQKVAKSDREITENMPKNAIDHETRKIIEEIFPFGTEESINLMEMNGKISIENIERHKRVLLAELKKSKPLEEIKKLNCFSMVDVDIDSPGYVNEKLVNVGFDTKDKYVGKSKDNVGNSEKSNYVAYFEEAKVENGKKDFDFDYQPDLNGHPGPSPSLILQALTMSNANDGINLERLETIGDSFLKFAITAYLYCAHPTVHEGKLSHMRSKQVSNLNLYRLGRNKRLGARMIASKFEPHDNWLPPCHKPPATLDVRPNFEGAPHMEAMAGEGCFIPYNLITQHSIPDKSIADCVEALIGAYLLSCGARGALLFMSWLGLRVLPRHTLPAATPAPPTLAKPQEPSPPAPGRLSSDVIDSETEQSSDEEDDVTPGPVPDDDYIEEDWGPENRVIGSLRPYLDERGEWKQIVFGELKAPPSPLLRYIEDPEGELEQMLSGYEALEATLQYRFRDRSLLLQALTHASHQRNRLTDCYQRLEFLGDAILDYLITRHLYEDERRHSPGALTDLRSALVNNTIFATLAVRHGFHKYFRHMSPGLNEVLTKYVKIQEENGHSISEEHYLIQEDEMEQAEDVEVPKALGDLFESVAGAIFLDSGMSLGAVWKSYVTLMGQELEAFSAAAPKSPVRELLEAEPDTAKFGKPERLADGRRVRVCVEVFGRGAFKGIGRNYRIAKGTAARCALRHLKKHRTHCS